MRRMRLLPGDAVRLASPVSLYERTMIHRVALIKACAWAVVCGVSVPCAPYWGAIRVLLCAGPGLLGWTSASPEGGLWIVELVVRNGIVHEDEQ